MEDLVPNDLFRDRYQRLEDKEGLTLSEVAYRCGWVAKDKQGREKPDSSRVSRALGLTADKGTQPRKAVTYDSAVALCKALHLDYWEAGL